MGKELGQAGHMDGHWRNREAGHVHEARRKSWDVSVGKKMKLANRSGPAVGLAAGLSLLWVQAWCLLGHWVAGSMLWARFEGLMKWVLFGPAKWT